MKIATRKNKKIIPVIITLVIILILARGYIAYAHHKVLWPYHNTKQTTPTTPLTFVPSKDDPNSTDPTYPDQKNSTPTTPSNASTSTGKKQIVSVAITYAGVSTDTSTIEVNAFISGVIEGTGTCTATLTKDTASVSGSAPAFVDATTTQCEAITIPRSKLSNGNWQAVVQYSSPTSTGTSEATKVSI